MWDQVIIEYGLFLLTFWGEADFAASHDKDDCIQVCLFSSVVTATPQQGKLVQRNTANTDVSCLSGLLPLGVAQPVYNTGSSQVPHKQWWCAAQRGFQLGLNLRSRLMITGCTFAELVTVIEEVAVWPRKGNCKTGGLKLWILFLIYDILFQNDHDITDRCLLTCHVYSDSPDMISDVLVGMSLLFFSG